MFVYAGLPILRCQYCYTHQPIMTTRNSTNCLEARWTSVDEYSTQRTHPSSRPNAKTLENTLSVSKSEGLPSYALSAAQGKFLALHCRATGVTHALEVGTLGGYSAIWLASENPELYLTTIESNHQHVDVARRNINAAGLDDRIEVICGAAGDVLQSLRNEVQAGCRSPFGFVFIDADKKSNWAYFRLAKDMLSPNAVICVDNIVREGQLVDLNDQDSSVLGSREVVEKAGREPGVDSTVLQTVGEKGYDGWLWAVISQPGSKERGNKA